MSSRARIQYRGYWGFPRIFLTRYEGHTFLFDCAFDETLDDYPDVFRVFLMPDLRDEELPKDWTTLKGKAIRFLGEVPTNSVQFDETRRQSIDTGILEELRARLAVAG
jgi:hypothetical protein